MPMPSPAAKTTATTAIAARRRFHLQLMPRRPAPCDSGCPARTFVRHQRHAPSSSTSSGAPQLPQTSTDPLTDCMITAICEPCCSCEPGVRTRAARRPDDDDAGPVAEHHPAPDHRALTLPLEEP